MRIVQTKKGREYEKSHPTHKKEKGTKNDFKRERILWPMFIL
jgi:hypothetical protein